jgi:hypothetical protein
MVQKCGAEFMKSPDNKNRKLTTGSKIRCREIYVMKPDLLGSNLFIVVINLWIFILKKIIKTR